MLRAGRRILHLNYLFIGRLICWSLHRQARCLAVNGFVIDGVLVDWLDDWWIVWQRKWVKLGQRAVWTALEGMTFLWAQFIEWSRLAYWAAFTENHNIAAQPPPGICDQIANWRQLNMAVMCHICLKMWFSYFPLQALYNSIKNQKLQWTL